MQARVVGSGKLSFFVIAGITVLGGAVSSANAQGALSYVGQGIYNALQSAQAAQRGSAWNVTTDNVFDADWIVQSPRAFGKRYSDFAQAVVCALGADCNPDFLLKRCKTSADCGRAGACAPYRPTVSRPGQVPENLCVGHSDHYVESLYNLMTSGQRFVDVTSLTIADGRYYAAMRNAVAYLSYKASPITVRALFASFPIQGSIDTAAVAKDFASRMRAGSPLKLHIGGYRSSNLPPSWNHSKIVAIDGRVAMSGGHNMWAKQYLGINPVNDLSMRVYGGAAADAHRFVNSLWAWTCSNRNYIQKYIGQSKIGSFGGGKLAENCPAQFDARAHTLAGKPAGAPAAVFSLGRLSRVDSKDASNSADHAFLAAIRAARKSIYVAQQDIGPVAIPMITIPLGAWPVDLFNELGRAILRGVDVTLVLSNLNAKAGGLSILEATYSNGWSTKVVAQKLKSYMAKLPGAPQGRALDDLLCRKLTVANWRYSADTTYPNNEPIPNHSKTFVIDERAVYIGSQNLYVAGLTEHGYLVDDARITADYLRRYWYPLWTASRGTSISGSLVPRASCQVDK